LLESTDGGPSEFVVSPFVPPAPPCLVFAVPGPLSPFLVHPTSFSTPPLRSSTVTASSSVLWVVRRQEEEGTAFVVAYVWPSSARESSLEDRASSSILRVWHRDEGEEVKSLRWRRPGSRDGRERAPATLKVPGTTLGASRLGHFVVRGQWAKSWVARWPETLGVLAVSPPAVDRGGRQRTKVFEVPWPRHGVVRWW
jgi:hypothetical protein